MPRPPILPTIDWSSLFLEGKDFESWLNMAENPAHRESMRHDAVSIPVAEAHRAMLANLSRDVYVVAIAEDWCGDVVRHVPALECLKLETPRLRVAYIARAERPDVFVRFLTNGGEAIPKFIFLNDNFVEYGNWGPMPDACKRCIARGKAEGDTATARAQVTTLYNADPDLREVVEELCTLIRRGGGG